jgi:hypothetical protein
MMFRVERRFEITRLTKTPRRGLKTLVLVSIETIQNIFEFDQGLTPPVGALKLTKLHLYSTERKETAG